MQVLVRSFCIAIGVALLGSATAWSALAPRAEGPPFTVTTGSPNNPRVATNAAGRTVVVWPGIGFRIYDAAGRAVTTDIKADEGGGGDYPRVALDSAGNIAVVWFRSGPGGPVDETAWLRLFDAQGAPQGSERQIDSGWTTGSSYPAIARDPGGRMLIAWTRFDGASTYSGWVRAFGADGQPLAAEQAIAGSNTSFPGDVSVDASGEYVVLFGNRWGARFDALGAQLAAAFPANEMGLSGSYDMASVARRPDGPFAVGWVDTPDNEVGETWIRLFDVNNTPREADVYFGSENDAVNRPRGRVACSARGDLALTWPGLFPPKLRTVDRDGQDMSSLLYLSENSTDLSIGMNARGDYTLVWRKSPTGIRAQRFCADMRVKGPEARSACIGGSAFFTVEATGRMPVAYRWRKNGVDLVDSTRVTGTRTPTLVIDPVESGDAGTYDCVITDACPAGGSLTSAGAGLTVGSGARIEEVTGLALTRAGTSLVLKWNNVPNATDYVVYEDIWPDTGFLSVAGTTTSAVTGLTLPMPRNDRFYRVSGRSTACGAARPR